MKYLYIIIHVFLKMLISKMNYCKCIIFSVYDIWWFFYFLLFKCGFNLAVDLNPLIQTFINAHLAVYTWRYNEYIVKCSTFTVI